MNYDSNSTFIQNIMENSNEKYITKYRKGYEYCINRKKWSRKINLINILINHLKAETGEIIDINHLLNLNHIGVLFQKRLFLG